MPFEPNKPGERRGGRQKGTPNKATADIKALALKYTPSAMERLHEIATKSKTDAASVAAIKEIFDRAYGRARQPLVGDDEADPIRVLQKIVLEGVKP